LGARTNLKSYNPTAPDAVLPALADISAYLYNDKDTDPLIKAALVHYQFEMIHPFEQYNGIVIQKNDNVRNRIWEYASLTSLFIQE
jgi:Fic family protein